MLGSQVQGHRWLLVLLHLALKAIDQAVDLLKGLLHVAGGRQILENLDDLAVDLRALQRVNLECQRVCRSSLIMSHVDAWLIYQCLRIIISCGSISWILIFHCVYLKID